MTLAETQTMRDAFKAAMLALATGASYTIGGRTLTRADAAWTSQQFAKWDARLSGLLCGRGSGPRVFRVMPRDL